MLSSKYIASDNFFWKDLNVQKTISSLSIVNQITSHDLNSMLFNSSGSSSSHDLIGDDRRAVMAEEIAKIKPFNTNRGKVVFFDKSMGSPFSGLNKTKVDSFVKRNKKNYVRKFHEKMLWLLRIVHEKQFKHWSYISADSRNLL